MPDIQHRVTYNLIGEVRRIQRKVSHIFGVAPEASHVKDGKTGRVQLLIRLDREL